MRQLSIIISILVFPLFALSLDVTAEVIEKGKTLKVKVGSYENKFTIDIPKGTELEKGPHVYGSNQFSIIVLEYADADSGTAIAYAVDSMGKKLWMKDMIAFNPSVPLIEDEFVYMAAVDRVWKVNKKTGKDVWKHENLYKTHKYNGGEPIKRDGKIIMFSSNLKLNDQSGKIMEDK